ncbi:MAG TPA: hypothetical protein VLJ16_00365 [Acidobacteriota bacterium]|nr:hypothetical protein [Acidobacteriota bacterium]
MNWKRFSTAAIAVFVSVQALEFLFNGVLLKSAYEPLKGLWRPNMSSRAWLMYVLSALVAVLFVYIFVKGRENKGLAEGVRFGLLMWLFIVVPMNVGWWVMLPIGWQIILRWILVGLLEMLVAGILVAAIYKPAAPAKAA